MLKISYKQSFGVILTLTLLASTSVFGQGFIDDPVAALANNQGMRAAGRFAVDVGNDIGNAFQARWQRQERMYNDQIRQQDAIINGNYSAEMKAAALAEKNAIQAERRSKANANSDLEAHFQKGVGDTAINMMQNIIQDHYAKQNQEREKQNVAIKASAAGKARVEAAVKQTQEWIGFLKDNPKLIIGASIGIPVTIIGCYYGIKHGSQYIADQARIPELIQETSLLSFTEKAKNWATGAPAERAELSDVKLDPVTTQRIKTTTLGLKNTVSNGAYLKNMLFWGPPGTGKTMVAKRMARSSGIHYMYFGGSVLMGFSEEEGIMQIGKAFRRARAEGVPVVIVIDEAELVLGDRNNPRMDQKARKFLTEILVYTGTETREYMVMALTNRPEDLDEAFLSRCDDRIFIGKPDATRRREIIDHYIQENLMKEVKPQPIGKSWLSIFSKAPEAAAQMKIEDGALSDQVRADIVQKTDGFVGRDLMKMVNEFRFASYVTDNCTLTAQIVQNVVNTKVKEYQEQLAKFNRQQAQANMAGGNSAAA